MPPKFLFDFKGLDLTRNLVTQEEIRTYNPQRGDMEHFNGVVFVDEPHGHCIGYKDVREDEFWVAGHLPGRPLFPGVLMIEAAAQASSFFTKKYFGWTGFMGFSAVENVRFRMQVTPPCRFYILIERLWARHKRTASRVQGVVNGSLVFEAEVIGVEM